MMTGRDVVLQNPQTEISEKALKSSNLRNHFDNRCNQRALQKFQSSQTKCLTNFQERIELETSFRIVER